MFDELKGMTIDHSMLPLEMIKFLKANKEVRKPKTYQGTSFVGDIFLPDNRSPTGRYEGEFNFGYQGSISIAALNSNVESRELWWGGWNGAGWAWFDNDSDTDEVVMQNFAAAMAVHATNKKLLYWTCVESVTEVYNSHGDTATHLYVGIRGIAPIIRALTRCSDSAAYKFSDGSAQQWIDIVMKRDEETEAKTGYAKKRKQKALSAYASKLEAMQRKAAQRNYEGGDPVKVLMWNMCRRELLIVNEKLNALN